jgi:hypothetical protein
VVLCREGGVDQRIDCAPAPLVIVGREKILEGLPALTGHDVE